MIPCGMQGVSGNEAAVVEYIKRKVGGETDNLGSLVVEKAGRGKRIAIACPVDEIGVFVTDVSDNIRFSLIGKAEPCELINRTVRFSNGVRGVICCDCAISDAKLSGLYIVADGDVKIGDIAAFSFEQIENGGKITGYSVERCLCTEVVLSAMELLKDTDFDITYMFTTMYKIGKKGLNAALLNKKPDYTVVVDTVSGEKIKCGSGPVVKITDGSYTADPILHEFARDKGITLTVCKEPEIRSANSVSLGAVCGYVSIPVEKTTGGILKGDITDCDKTARFLKELVAKVAEI